MQSKRNDERRERLEEIVAELKALAREALDLLDGSGDRTWFPAIVCAIDRDHEYLSRPHTLADDIKALALEDLDPVEQRVARPCGVHNELYEPEDDDCEGAAWGKPLFRGEERAGAGEPPVGAALARARNENLPAFQDWAEGLGRPKAGA